MSSCSYKKLDQAYIEGHNPSDVTKTPVVKKRSCLKTCLVVSLILIGVFFAIVLVAAGFAYGYTAKVVRRWTVTETNRRHFGIVHLPETTLDIFNIKAGLFWDRMQNGKDDDLVVTAEILNGLVYQSDYLRGNAYIAIDAHYPQITTNLFLPMDFMPGGKGRYLAGKQTETWNEYDSVLTIKMEPFDDETDVTTPYYKGWVSPYYHFEFHLSAMEDGEWNLVLLSGQFLDWYLPHKHHFKHDNILDPVYDCVDNDDYDGRDEECQQWLNVLDALTVSFLGKDQVIFHSRPTVTHDIDHRRLITADAPTKKSSFHSGMGMKVMRHLIFKK